MFRTLRAYGADLVWSCRATTMPPLTGLRLLKPPLGLGRLSPLDRLSRLPLHGFSRAAQVGRKLPESALRAERRASVRAHDVAHRQESDESPALAFAVEHGELPRLGLAHADYGADERVFGADVCATRGVHELPNLLRAPALGERAAQPRAAHQPDEAHARVEHGEGREVAAFSFKRKTRRRPRAPRP